MLDQNLCPYHSAKVYESQDQLFSVEFPRWPGVYEHHPFDINPQRTRVSDLVRQWDIDALHELAGIERQCAIGRTCKDSGFLAWERGAYGNWESEVNGTCFIISSSLEGESNGVWVWSLTVTNKDGTKVAVRNRFPSVTKAKLYALKWTQY